jgi:hypothetical protein
MLTLPKKWWLVAAIAVPGLAMADAPAPQAQTLATVDTVLEHCAKLIPSSADLFREHVKLMTHGISEEMLAKLRSSDEYRTARDSIVESLAKTGDEDAKQACQQFSGS